MSKVVAMAAMSKAQSDMPTYKSQYAQDPKRIRRTNTASKRK